MHQISLVEMILVEGSSYEYSTSNPHSKQIVSFIINYGDIFSYKYKPNIQIIAKPSEKSKQ